MRQRNPIPPKKFGIDFTKHKRSGNTISAVRAKQYDEWTKDFIAKNKNAVVVHLGCGLDARITRIQPPSSSEVVSVSSRVSCKIPAIYDIFTAPIFSKDSHYFHRMGNVRNISSFTQLISSQILDK
jgi:hypothetical protein